VGLADGSGLGFAGSGMLGGVAIIRCGWLRRIGLVSIWTADGCVRHRFSGRIRGWGILSLSTGRIRGCVGL
jgi:hypothetical protein